MKTVKDIGFEFTGDEDGETVGWGVTAGVGAGVTAGVVVGLVELLLGSPLMIPPKIVPTMLFEGDGEGTGFADAGSVTLGLVITSMW